MRRVIFYVAASLDGYLARRDGELDWLPLPTDAEDYGYAALLARVDTLMMGRKTYDVTRGFGAWPYPAHRTVVFSRATVGLIAPGVEFSSDDPVAMIRQLRATEGRDLWLVGGGELARICLEGRVVDEIILTLIPVLLGDGLPVFPSRDSSSRLVLRTSRAFADGLVQLHHDVVI